MTLKRAVSEQATIMKYLFNDCIIFCVIFQHLQALEERQSEVCKIMYNAVVNAYYLYNSVFSILCIVHVHGHIHLSQVHILSIHHCHRFNIIFVSQVYINFHDIMYQHCSTLTVV